MFPIAQPHLARLPVWNRPGTENFVIFYPEWQQSWIQSKACASGGLPPLSSSGPDSTLLGLPLSLENEQGWWPRPAPLRGPSLEKVL